jgi:glycosyltransferase involved in cell wall biosynthesis
MKILFIHQNFPGQYRHVASALADDPNNTVVAIGEGQNIGRLGHPRITEIGYKTPKPAGKETHHYLKSTEAGIRRGQQIIRVADRLQHQGFTPDIVCCHPAWGEGLFLRDIWPETPLLYFFEFFYRPTGLDTNFDPEFLSSRDSIYKTRIRNTIHLQSLHQADHGVSPTHWQHSSLPAEYRDRVSVIFDGIDTGTVAPNPAAELKISEHLTLTKDDEVITFVNRNLEPYRGYHRFMRALPELMQQRPDAQFVVVGGDGVSYGPAPPKGQSYKQIFLKEVEDRVDMSRLHFLGRVPYETFLSVLQISSVHVYLTYPFVLSWSLVEAMSAGCAIVASATPPVEEVIDHEKNGLLFNFFDTGTLVEQVCRVLEHPDRMANMRQAARETVIERYDLKQVCLPQQLALIERLAARRASAS